MGLFSKEDDYAAFESLLEETRESRPMRICVYFLMPNHWRFVLWPEHDGDLAAFMQQLTTKHVRRWQLHRRRVGYGHVYQSRYKSFPVEEESHFYQLVRYVERNSLRANLVERAEDWKWSSLWRRTSGTPEQKQLLSHGPVPYPRGRVPRAEADSLGNVSEWGQLVQLYSAGGGAIGLFGQETPLVRPRLKGVSFATGPTKAASLGVGSWNGRRIVWHGSTIRHWVARQRFGEGRGELPSARALRPSKTPGGAA